MIERGRVDGEDGYWVWISFFYAWGRRLEIGVFFVPQWDRERQWFERRTR